MIVLLLVSKIDVYFFILIKTNLGGNSMLGISLRSYDIVAHASNIERDVKNSCKLDF